MGDLLVVGKYIAVILGTWELQIGGHSALFLNEFRIGVRRQSKTKLHKQIGSNSDPKKLQGSKDGALKYQSGHRLMSNVLHPAGYLGIWKLVSTPPCFLMSSGLESVGRVRKIIVW